MKIGNTHTSNRYTLALHETTVHRAQNTPHTVNRMCCPDVTSASLGHISKSSRASELCHLPTSAKQNKQRSLGATELNLLLITWAGTWYEALDTRASLLYVWSVQSHRTSYPAKRWRLTFADYGSNRAISPSPTYGNTNETPAIMINIHTDGKIPC